MDWMSHAMDWMSHAMDWMGRSSPALYALSSESPPYPIRLRIRVQPTRMRAGPMSAVCDSETASVPRVASMLGRPPHALRTEKAADVRTRMSGPGCRDPDVRTRMSGLGCQDSSPAQRRHGYRALSGVLSIIDVAYILSQLRSAIRMV